MKILGKQSVVVMRLRVFAPDFGNIRKCQQERPTTPDFAGTRSMRISR
jgi:hypothetical protein